MSGAFQISSAKFETLGIKSIQNTIISKSVSGKKLARQIDGQRWSFTARIITGSRSDVYGQLMAFIVKQRSGKENFTIIPPEIEDARGSETGTVLVNGDHAVGDNTIAMDSLGGTTFTKTVTVQDVSGSNKYFIDGVQTPTLELIEGNTYIFDQSDSSNATHPLRFYTAADKSGGEYTTGVTVTGTPGSTGAETKIVVATSATTLYYQCSSHANMGGQANTPSASDTAGVFKAGDFIKFASHTKVYMVVEDVTSSSNAATVTIEPPLISTVANNSVVTYDNVPFTVYLTNDIQEFGAVGSNKDGKLLYQFEFDVEESL